MLFWGAATGLFREHNIFLKKTAFAKIDLGFVFFVSMLSTSLHFFLSFTANVHSPIHIVPSN